MSKIDYTTLPPDALLRSADFLRPGPVPMGRTLWAEMVADGRAPAPAVRQGRLTAWRWGDIRKFLADLADGAAV
ncbi:helix-turn-helix transcriptional regulator [Immundisolibacter sp.]